MVHRYPVKALHGLLNKQVWIQVSCGTPVTYMEVIQDVLVCTWESTRAEPLTPKKVWRRTARWRLADVENFR